jgi:Primase C terminal 2 (PriCT-2)
MIPVALNAASFVPVPAGEKIPNCKGWPEMRLSAEEIQPHLAAGGNVALRVGRLSDDLVDVDLDSREAIELANLYLPPTGAEFGRPSKPRSHRLYKSPGTVFAAYADPTTGEMLAELRADGREGGAHLSLIPPSVTYGERREWFGETVEPAAVDAAVLARRMAWLAIGCLMFRHISEHTARHPAPDLPALLWEADHTLGRAAYRWLGEPAPDEPRRSPKHRREMSREEIDLAELVASIPNNFDWIEWNRLGMAIYAATGGSEEGFVAFDDLSARSSKYNPHATRERWSNYRRSPPSRIGIGSIVHLAREAGWRRGSAA